MILTIVQFVVVLGALLAAHELGHFIMARLVGVEVEEFGFGIPPRIFGRKVGNVLVSINAIPFGAFVRPKGEGDPTVPGGLAAASPWSRMAVVAGGPLASLLLGFVVYVALFSQVGRPDTSIIQVMEVAKASPAEAAGMLPGDIITAVAGHPIATPEDIQAITRDFAGESVSMDITRGDTQLTIAVTPRANPPEGQGPVGFVMGHPYFSIPWYQAIPVAFSTLIEQARQLFSLPIRLISGAIAPQDARIIGPKGIFDIYSAASQSDAAAASSAASLPAVAVLSFIGTISIAVGLTNLFPFPALDGGRMLFILPELLFRKRIPQRIENLVNSIGMLSLLTLMVFITIQDIINPIITK
jgi:regulator of sigma E protease